jgi:hypothetical protein
MKTNANNTRMRKTHSKTETTAASGEESNFRNLLELSPKVIVILKEPGNWKTSPFIFALEDFQKNIQNGFYTSIDDCIENEHFSELSRADQEQLIDIALWYVHDVSQGI